MKRRTSVVSLAFILVAAAVTLFNAARNDVATTPGSSTESVNEILTPNHTAPIERQLEPNSPPAKPDNARTKEGGTRKLRIGNAESWPTNIEGRIWKYFAHRGKSNIVSINSVECTNTNCVIEIATTDVNPRHVGEVSQLTSDMFRQNWNMTSGSVRTREIAPGARVFVIDISNVPVDMEELRRDREAAQEPQSRTED